MAMFFRVTVLLMAFAALATSLAQAAVQVAKAAHFETRLARALQDRNFVSLLLRRTH